MSQDIVVELGLLSEVDGSAKLLMNSTNVLCAVTGPVEPKARQELPTEMALEVIVRPAKGVPTPREKYLEDKIRAIFTPLITRHKYPRQLCQITCQIMEAGENEQLHNQKELSACVNSALLALVNAGVALNDLAAAVTIAVIDDQSQENKAQYIIGPSDEELEKSSSVHTIAMEVGDNGKKVKRVLLIESNGIFNDKVIFDILELGESACLNLCSNWRGVLTKHIQKELDLQSS